MTNVCWEDFIEVKSKRVLFQIVVIISIQECASVRGHCAISMKVAPVTLSARQWPSNRRYGRSGVMETSCLVSDAAVTYVLAKRYSSLNSWSPHSVFKDKERKLRTEQFLNIYRLKVQPSVYREMLPVTQEQKANEP